MNVHENSTSVREAAVALMGYDPDSSVTTSSVLSVGGRGSADRAFMIRSVFTALEMDPAVQFTWKENQAAYQSHFGYQIVGLPIQVARVLTEMADRLNLED